jgi:hypothetical protein
LEEDAEENLFYYAVRADRAVADGMMERMADGRIPSPNAQGMIRSTIGGHFSMDFLKFYLALATPEMSRAAMLDKLNQLVEASKIAPPERHQKVKEIEAMLAHQPAGAGIMLSGGRALCGLEPTFTRSIAELRCAAVMLAVERYRLEKGAWPNSLDDLVPAYLSKVPVDPFDGKPLRYRRFDQGVKIYSVGDGVDDGGEIDKRTHRGEDLGTGPGADLGFRLVDVKYRRQPAKPLKLPGNAD